MLATSECIAAWSASVSKVSGELFCTNPKCVHLFASERDGDSLTFTPLDVPMESKVDIVVNGVEEVRFRFPPNGHIHLGCRGVCADNVRHVANGHLVCGGCMKANAHVGVAGACRACANEATDKTARVTDADCAGPRLPSVETINNTMHVDAVAVEQLQETQFDELRGRNVDGGEARRKQELARRKANAETAKACVSASRAKSKEAKQRLRAMHLGSMFLDNEDNPERVSTEGECKKEAKEFFDSIQETDLDIVGEIRREFPLHALLWFGVEPTESQIAAQQELVEKLDQEHKAQKESCKLVVFEAEKAEEEVKKQNIEFEDDDEEEKPQDEDEEEEPPKKKRKGPKKPEDMTAEELEAHKTKKKEATEKRKEDNKVKKEKLEKYPELKAKAEKYARAKVLLAEQKAENEQMKADAEEAAERVQHTQAAMWKLARAWVRDPQGKPDGWNSEEQLKALSAILKKASA